MSNPATAPPNLGKLSSGGNRNGDSYKGSCKPVYGVRGEIRQVISKLLINAIEAVQEGGIISLETRSDRTDMGSAIGILVAHDGHGFAGEDVAIFSAGIESRANNYVSVTPQRQRRRLTNYVQTGICSRMQRFSIRSRSMRTSPCHLAG